MDCIFGSTFFSVLFSSREDLISCPCRCHLDVTRITVSPAQVVDPVRCLSWSIPLPWDPAKGCWRKECHAKNSLKGLSHRHGYEPEVTKGKQCRTFHWVTEPKPGTRGKHWITPCLLHLMTYAFMGIFAWCSPSIPLPVVLAKDCCRCVGVEVFIFKC